MSERLSFIPYPPIEKHGAIGDRRTAALVAADGTLDWLCLPDYDGESLCAALLDAKEGGYWRFGPSMASLGQQRYLGESAALVTTWTTRAPAASWAARRCCFPTWSMFAQLWPWQKRASRAGSLVCLLAGMEIAQKIVSYHDTAAL
ncbi:MAG TPA: trehalase-like domain-containing protein [Ktedonobacterales bacterium]|nr:trehalase-like domain-containing protein [Ktedonobacterales bacterium]